MKSHRAITIPTESTPLSGSHKEHRDKRTGRKLAPIAIINHESKTFKVSTKDQVQRLNEDLMSQTSARSHTSHQFQINSPKAREELRSVLAATEDKSSKKYDDKLSDVLSNYSAQ